MKNKKNEKSKDKSLEEFLRKETNLHIRVLRYADAHPAFTMPEIIDDLNLFTEQITFLQREVATGKFLVNVGDSPNGRGYRYMLTLEGKSRLIEYDELTEARRSSKEARWIAIAAVIISIMVGLFQIFNVQDVRIVNEDNVIEAT